MPINVHLRQLMGRGIDRIYIVPYIGDLGGGYLKIVSIVFCFYFYTPKYWRHENPI